jgi:CheY-like chemotaxis protein
LPKCRPRPRHFETLFNNNNPGTRPLSTQASYLTLDTLFSLLSESRAASLAPYLLHHLLTSPPAPNLFEAAIAAAIPVLIPGVRPPGAVKVLHIEDDPGVARSIARALRLGGYEVISAATRDEVMQHLEVHGLRPDLILTDFQLGTDITGNMIVAEIAARLQFKPPTILLTGVSGPRVEHAKACADRVLTKPVDISVLLRAIEDLLAARK